MTSWPALDRTYLRIIRKWQCEVKLNHGQCCSVSVFAASESVSTGRSTCNSAEPPVCAFCSYARCACACAVQCILCLYLAYYTRAMLHVRSQSNISWTWTYIGMNWFQMGHDFSSFTWHWFQIGFWVDSIMPGESPYLNMYLLRCS